MTNRELNYLSEGYILGRKKGGGANIQPLTVTENKEYNAADYGCDGFQPVLVNVPAAVKSITITKNGTYTPPAGYDGYNPVIVKNPYETLYKLEHGGGDDIDTNIPDDEGNDIIINGEQVDNLDALNDLINAATIAGAPVEVAVSDGTNIIKLKLEIVYSVKGDYEYVDPKMTMENMKTGQSYSAPPNFPFYMVLYPNYKAESHIIDRITSSYVSQNMVLRSQSTGNGVQCGESIYYSKVGIDTMNTKKLKYYILGGV